MTPDAFVELQDQGGFIIVIEHYALELCLSGSILHLAFFDFHLKLKYLLLQP